MTMPLPPHTGNDHEEKPAKPADSLTPKISDISAALGLSIGTVDRALHNRPEISRATKRRVLAMAEAMGYRRNLAASLLAKKKKLRISVNLPREPAAFYDEIRAGIRAESEELAQAAIELEFRSFPELGDGEIEAFQSAIAAKVDGIIATFGHPRELRAQLAKASRSNIPVVTVVSGVPAADHLAAISIDPAVSGALAAELMAGFQRAGGRVAVETGDLKMWEHATKVRAFKEGLAKYAPHLKTLKPIETHERDIDGYRQMCALLEKYPDVVGCYASTVNSLSIIRALKEKQKLGQVTLITTDLYPKLAPHLRSGAVNATLHQRPRVQGRLAVRALFNFLNNKVPSTDRLILQPHIVMRANLARFLDELDETSNIEIA
jgi:LacI family transcriptional regulator